MTVTTEFVAMCCKNTDTAAALAGQWHRTVCARQQQSLKILVFLIKIIKK